MRFQLLVAGSYEVATAAEGGTWRVLDAGTAAGTRLRLHDVSPEVCALCRLSGVETWCWTVNERAATDAVVAAGVQGITTSRHGLVMDWLGQSMPWVSPPEKMLLNASFDLPDDAQHVGNHPGGWPRAGPAAARTVSTACRRIRGHPFLPAGGFWGTRECPAPSTRM